MRGVEDVLYLKEEGRLTDRQTDIHFVLVRTRKQRVVFCTAEQGSTFCGGRGTCGHCKERARSC
jgi:hypothetical protein